MKKKVLIIIWVVLVIIIAKLILNIIVNNSLINKYQEGKYPVIEVVLLRIANIMEPYVLYYNYGNFLHQNQEYEKAIEQYENALQESIPKYKECKVRINYALTICKTVKVDERYDESIINAIEIYELAIDILEDKGCTEHNESAKRLRDDIQAEIDRLKKLLYNDVDKNTSKEEKENSQIEDKLEEKIQNIKEEATKEQRNVEASFNELEQYYEVNRIERKSMVRLQKLFLINRI